MGKWKPRVPFRNTEGRLYRHIDIKVIIGPDVKTKRHRAAPGKGYTLENIREACDTMIEALEKGFPGVEFREVQVAPNAFNYIAIKPEPKPEPVFVLEGELYCSSKRRNDEDNETTAKAAGDPVPAGIAGQIQRESDGPGAESERAQRSDP